MSFKRDLVTFIFFLNNIISNFVFPGNFQGKRRAVLGADKPYHLHVPIVLKSESINLLELRDCPDLHRDCFTLHVLLIYTPIHVDPTDLPAWDTKHTQDMLLHHRNV